MIIQRSFVVSTDGLELWTRQSPRHLALQQKIRSLHLKRITSVDSWCAGMMIRSGRGLCFAFDYWIREHTAHLLFDVDVGDLRLETWICGLVQDVSTTFWECSQNCIGRKLSMHQNGSCGCKCVDSEQCHSAEGTYPQIHRHTRLMATFLLLSLN